MTTDTFYTEAVKPLNQCAHMGLERLIYSDRFFSRMIYMSKDNYGQYRIWLSERGDRSKIWSAIVFDNNRTVKVRYTIPEARGNHHTKHLFALACQIAKKSFRHSPYLTEAGASSL